MRRLARLPWRRLGRFVERTLAITGAMLLIFHGFFEVSEFTSSSMAPLLVGSDRGAPDVVLIEKRLTARRAPSRFEVIAFVNDDGIPVAKRVVAFPGETVQVLRDRSLVIDGKRVATPEGVGEGKGYLPAGNLHADRPFLVPPGQVYYLGDDTRDSLDSRFSGALPVERIRGRVLIRILPFSRFKSLIG